MGALIHSPCNTVWPAVPAAALVRTPLGRRYELVGWGLIMQLSNIEAVCACAEAADMLKVHASQTYSALWHARH